MKRAATAPYAKFMEMDDLEIAANIQEKQGFLFGDDTTSIEALTKRQMEIAERNYEAAKERLNHRNFITSGLTERLLMQ